MPFFVWKRRPRSNEPNVINGEMMSDDFPARQAGFRSEVHPRVRRGYVPSEIVLCRCAAIGPIYATADWTENFDSYPNDAILHNLGGWRGWTEIHWTAD